MRTSGAVTAGQGRRTEHGRCARAWWVAALVLCSCHDFRRAEVAPGFLARGRSAGFVQEGEVTLRDGEAATVYYKIPFQSPPHVMITEFRESRFKNQVYSKQCFTFPVQTATYFRIQNNHAEPDIGGWAIVRWRAEGVRGPEPAAGSGALGPMPQDARARPAWVAAYVKKLGGTTTVDTASAGRPVIGVDLHGTRVTDADLALLRELPGLRTLNLYNTRVTDTGLAHVRGLTRLQVLYLNDTQVTDGGLQYIQGLTELSELGLYRTRVTDGGLVYVMKLTNLHRLALSGPQITDRGLTYLTGLKRLKELDLLGTRVSDRGVQQLQAALPWMHIARN